MDDPDWMNDFKSPTENVLLHLSSSSPSYSPPREGQGKFLGKGEDVSVSNGKDGSDDEDSPLISVLRDRRAAKKGGQGRKATTPQETGKSRVKRAAETVRKGALEDDDDEEEESPKVESRRPRGNKRKKALESEDEDDDEEYQIPSKVRKTSASPQVKKATPKSGRKGRRVSFSEEEGTPQVKRVKMEVSSFSHAPMEPVAIDEEDHETKPISSLVRTKDKTTTASATPSASPSVGGDDSELTVVPKELTGTSALAALRDPGGTAVDGEDILSTKEAANYEEATGEVSEQNAKPRTSGNLPVIFAEKVHRTKVLLECEGDALDLSGDMGAVGRFSVSSGKEKGEDELFLDLKGIIYKATIVPSNTFFLVNVGHAEAKVEAIMNDFMQLQPDTHQVQDETLVEGTLEGFELENDNDGEPLSTPVTASVPEDSDADEDDSKQKKKAPTKLQKQKKVPSKGGKGSRAKGAGKGATSKKPRAKAKGTTKKPSKAKTGAAKNAKSKKP